MSDVSPLLQSAYWIVLAPVIAASAIILSYLLGIKINRTVAMGLSVGAVAYGFIHSILIFLVLRDNATPYVTNIDWFVVSNFKLAVGLLVDNLAAVMLIVVTTVSLLVQIYTHGYMREDPGYSRFYAYLSLFTASMLGLVVSTNLFQMYIFWELVGVCSYFLIGFWWYKPSAAYACLKAFVVNRVGDFGFLVGILFLLLATFGFWQAHNDQGILMFMDPSGHGVDLSGAIQWGMQHGTLTTTFLGIGALTLISILIFMGPMAKSAQVPLHVWLPDAMEGPTPISALIHAATMVAAGVYMVARAYPIWLNWTDPLHPTVVGAEGLTVVAWIGGITAFIAATIALTQFDIKRTLAWSTVSQLGYMFVGLGVGAFTGGIFHLFNHAFFKAMLFLCSGVVIHGLHGEQDMRNMGGLRKPMFWTSLCFLIGTLSISGFPGLSGFFSKDEIIVGAWDFKGYGHEILGWLMIFTAGLTAFYMFRMYLMTFCGEYRGQAHPHKDSAWSPLTTPLLVLAVPSILSGYLGCNLDVLKSFSLNPNAFSQFIHFGQHAHVEEPNHMVMLISIAVSLSGMVLAFLVYMTKALPINTWLTNAAICKPFYNLFYNKWCFDYIYEDIFLKKILLPVYTGIWNLIDMLIIDNIVNLNRTLALVAAEVLKHTENGRGQYYAMVIFACVAGITLYVWLYVR